MKNSTRPAIDSALSVSRVGSTAQFKLLKKLVGTIKNELTLYRHANLDCMFYQD